MHTLLFHEPGHFHAALLLAARNPRVDPSVHVYATPGPDLDRFVALIDRFNARSNDPTDWRLQLHTEPEPLARLIADRRGGIVVVAGRNEPKLATIARLHAAGFNVLADKPWLTTSAALGHLYRATAGPPLVADIMSQRHDPIARLRQRVVTTETVTGQLASLEFQSVHHLCKVVDGRPLQRPPWYYDVRVQGDGLVDIQSHSVDQAQWMVDAAHRDDPAALDAIPIREAKRWSTAVPAGVFAESTSLEVFPDALDADVRDGVLHLACNGQIEYFLAGVRVRQRAEWHLRPPSGGGDTHRSTAYGQRAVVTLAHGPETGDAPELHIVSAEAGPIPDDRLSAALTEWEKEFPGLTAQPSGRGYQLALPPSALVSHEATFALVLDDFLDRVDGGAWSPSVAARIRNRYRLLARATTAATDLAEPPPPET